MNEASVLLTTFGTALFFVVMLYLVVTVLNSPSEINRRVNELKVPPKVDSKVKEETDYGKVKRNLLTIYQKTDAIVENSLISSEPVYETHDYIKLVVGKAKGFIKLRDLFSYDSFRIHNGSPFLPECVGNSISYYDTLHLRVQRKEIIRFHEALFAISFICKVGHFPSAFGRVYYQEELNNLYLDKLNNFFDWVEEQEGFDGSSRFLYECLRLVDANGAIRQVKEGEMKPYNKEETQ